MSLEGGQAGMKRVRKVLGWLSAVVLMLALSSQAAAQPKFVPANAPNILALVDTKVPVSGTVATWRMHVIASGLDPLKGIAVKYYCVDPANRDPNSHAVRRGVTNFKLVSGTDTDGVYEASADLGDLRGYHCFTWFAELIPESGRKVTYGSPSSKDGGYRKFPFKDTDFHIPR
jgi:hypothetical protein